MDLLVMENIFYEGQLAPIYDLKGSERARLAREDPRDPACVLLDQNLANSNVHSPLLVRPLVTKPPMACLHIEMLLRCWKLDWLQIPAVLESICIRDVCPGLCRHDRRLKRGFDCAQVAAREHEQLLDALWADTALLAGLGVMDYSLLVGVDQARGTLVVAIIDFVRQARSWVLLVSSMAMKRAAGQNGC